LEPRRRVDKALYAVVMEAYTGGIFTQGPLEVCPSSPRRALISALLCDGTALHAWHPRPKHLLLQLI
jgi:hypothetical protein